jgi:hypothetical protein
MLGVDRLDMIKGIPQKILAFEKFLEENPEWNDKVVLLQIAVPTRTDVPECKSISVSFMATTPHIFQMECIICSAYDLFSCICFQCISLLSFSKNTISLKSWVLLQF